MRSDATFGDLRSLREKMVVWARRMTRGGPSTEDLVQTALLKMFSNRHRFDPAAGGAEQWARVVLLNVFHDNLRAARRAPLMLDITDMPLVAPDNPETSTYCRQVFRRCLGLDPSLLFDPDSNGQRWEGGIPKTVTERRKRYRARQALQQVAA